MDVSGLASGVATISAGASHSCAITTGGAVKCWGSNEYGKLGNGQFSGVYTAPQDATGLSSGMADIAAGGSHTCATTTSGEARCWGSRLAGQVGNGTTGAYNNPQLTPATVIDFTLQDIIFAAPGNRDLAASPFTVSATASSGLAVGLTSTTPSVCTVSGTNVTLLAVGICSIAADQSGDATYFMATQVVRSLLVTNTSSATAARLAGISTRMRSLRGNDSPIAGFIVQGPGPKTVLIRARGPSLAASGVANPIPTTLLRLYSGASEIDRNQYWQSGPKAQVIQDIGFAPASQYDSALLVTLQPGAYTANAKDVIDTEGVEIVEVFELDNLDNPLLGISTRAKVLTGDDVVIGGFIIGGTSPLTVVVRARGPSLTAQGVPGVLANPMLQLVSAADGSVVTNDDWGTAADAATLQAIGYAPSDAQEAAILITLNPGAYTAIMSGVGGTTGVGIVEVYKP